MRILQLVTRRQYRGAEVFASQLSTELIAMGDEVVFAGLYAPPAGAILHLPGALNVDLSDLSPRQVPHYLILQQINRLVRKEHIDLIQANSSDNLKYAILSRLLFGWDRPIVFRNASILTSWLRGRIHWALNRSLLMAADAIACVSRQSHQDLEHSLGIPAGKLHYLPIGTQVAGLDQLSPSEVVPGVPQRAWKLIHIGAFSREKNHAALLKLLQTLPERVDGRAIHLILVGEGPLRSATEEAAHATGLFPRVHFLGYRKDVSQLLAASDLFVLPSLIEGTPGVLLEAGIAGTPAVAYDVGAVRECLSAEATTWTVDTNDEIALARTVCSALRDAEGRQRVAEAQRLFVTEHFDIRVIAKQFRGLYQVLKSAGEKN